MSHRGRILLRAFGALGTVVVVLGLVASRAAGQDGVTKPAVSVVTKAPARLASIRTVVLFLQGNDPFALRILEDSIALHLEREGVGAITRELIERAVGDEIAKRRKERSDGGMNALDVAKAVKAEAVVTGTVLFDPEERRSVIVRVLSFQVLDAEQGASLVNAVLTYEKGGSALDVAQRIARMMKGRGGD